MPVASVGDAAEASLAVGEQTIDDYAALVGDDNPIHLDGDYAADTMFGGRVAHGMLSAGVVSAALADLPGDIVYVKQELDFERPVRPGQTVTATATVVEAMGGDRVRVETAADVGADGDEDRQRVLSGEAVVLSVPHAE
ncbi:MaoC family dehydratase [Halorussus marinus]|uniref:MaoC family dehydratase n=1 Tax=Halorussus marinus TaxID=2505976 RepID=UPI00106E4BE9|nr:MaoC family dehydratase [Halorussus marinus]